MILLKSEEPSGRFSTSPKKNIPSNPAGSCVASFPYEEKG